MLPDDLCNTSLTAATGHKGDLPKEGTLMTLTLSLFGSVLEHLMSILIPGGAKIRWYIITRWCKDVLRSYSQKLNEEQD